MSSTPAEQSKYDLDWQPEVWQPTQEQAEALRRYEAMIQQELANPVRNFAPSRRQHHKEGRS